MFYCRRYHLIALNYLVILIAREDFFFFLAEQTAAVLVARELIF